MVHLSLTSLLLALLLSLLLGLKYPTVLAHKEVATVGDSVHALETVKEPLRGTEKMRLRGRKLGVEDIVVLKEEEENTGNVMTTSSKPYQTSTTKDYVEQGDHSRTSLHGKSHISEVSFSTHHGRSGSEGQPSVAMGTQELLDANAEIFKMMNKDYHAKARSKPPINNDLPQKDHGESVTP